MGAITKLYLASVGLVSPIGMNLDMTWSSFRAGISRQALSDYRSKSFHPIRVASAPNIPEELNSAIKLPESGELRYTKMLLLAQQAISQNVVDLAGQVDKPLPMFVSVPESLPQSKDNFCENFISDLVLQAELKEFVDVALSRKIASGRSGAIEALDMAYRYHESTEAPYSCIGGIDSFDETLLEFLDDGDRLNHEAALQGFIPGEGAAFLIVTPFKQLARSFGEFHIIMGPPSTAYERGHLYSEEPYLGEGLAESFAGVFKNVRQTADTLFTSLNGEQYWSKELGVATIRHQKFLHDPYNVEHPADCYGDLGAGCGGALLALSAQHLAEKNSQCLNLVYCSSDAGNRCTVLMGRESI